MLYIMGDTPIKLGLKDQNICYLVYQFVLDGELVNPAVNGPSVRIEIFLAMSHSI